MVYLEVTTIQSTLWTQKPTTFKELGHVPENFEFLEMLSGVLIWKNVS